MSVYLPKKQKHSFRKSKTIAEYSRETIAIENCEDLIRSITDTKPRHFYNAILIDFSLNLSIIKDTEKKQELKDKLMIAKSTRNQKYNINPPEYTFYDFYV